ncbi:MAG: VanZ family protein, partial [Armatimonadaceae bacterium]
MSRWKFGIGALAWMGLIYWLSTGTGSTENTRPLVAVLVDWIQPGLADRLGPDWLGRLDWIVRKTAHMTEYAVLTGLLLGALRGPGGVSTTTYAIAALIAAAPPAFLGLSA